MLTIAICSHRKEPNHTHVEEEEEPGDQRGKREDDVDDEHKREQQRRLPCVKPVQYHTVSLILPYCLPFFMDSDLPHVIAPMLQHKQQYPPCRRQQQVRQTRLPIHPYPQPCLEQIQILPSTYADRACIAPCRVVVAVVTPPSLQIGASSLRREVRRRRVLVSLRRRDCRCAERAVPTLVAASGERGSRRVCW